MTTYPIVARGHRFWISTDNTTWTEILGITSWEWTEDQEMIDATDFATDGYKAELPVLRAVKVSVEGHYLVNPTTNARDPGQAAVEDAARLFGPSALVYFRVETEETGTPPQPVARMEGRCTIKLKAFGGGVADKMKWGFDVAFYGAPTYSGAWA